MAVTFVNVSADVATTTTTLALVAPALNVGDIIIASIYGATNVALTNPDARWSTIRAFNNTAAMRHTVAFLRAEQGDSGKTFNFGVVGTVLSYGILGVWRGAATGGSPIGASGQTATGVQDSVVYPAIQPVNDFSMIVACGTYALNATTAGAMSGVDPTFTNRADAETATSTTASLFIFDGISSGAALASQSHTTTSTVDAINTGVFFELIAESEVDDQGGSSGGAQNAKFPAIIRYKDKPSASPFGRQRPLAQY